MAVKVTPVTSRSPIVALSQRILLAQRFHLADMLDSSKMTLMPSTTRNKANVHSRAKRSLAKVCGAAESGLSLLGAML
jgi:hypothetical protein